MIACAEDLDSYNGYLGDDRYYSMDELDELFYGSKPSEILQKAFFGEDEEGGSFNPNREYFKFNGYGNLVSADSKDYSAYCDHYFVNTLLENRNWIDSIDNYDELKSMLDQLEDA